MCYKFILLAISLLLSANFAKSQVYIDDININSIDSIKYCEIVGVDVGLFKKNLVVAVDYGQKTRWSDDTSIKGADGNRVSFNSMVDALNFMHATGWEFITTYTISVSSGGAVYHFLLKKKES